MKKTALLLLVLLFVTACKFGLNTKKLEGLITSSCKAKGLELTSVQCPKRSEKKGDTFDCTGTTADGQALVFHVTQTDSKGNVDWKLDGAIVDAKKVGDSIKGKIGAQADVKCPSKVTVLTKGKVLNCAATINNKDHMVQVTANEDASDVNWKIMN